MFNHCRVLWISTGSRSATVWTRSIRAVAAAISLCGLRIWSNTCNCSMLGLRVLWLRQVKQQPAGIGYLRMPTKQQLRRHRQLCQQQLRMCSSFSAHTVIAPIRLRRVSTIIYETCTSMGIASARRRSRSSYARCVAWKRNRRQPLSLICVATRAKSPSNAISVKWPSLGTQK